MRILILNKAKHVDVNMGSCTSSSSALKFISGHITFYEKFEILSGGSQYSKCNSIIYKILYDTNTKAYFLISCKYCILFSIFG